MSETAFAIGEVVRFHRGEYSHVAVYIGRGSVIHLWSPTTARAFSVRIDSIRHVQNCQQSSISSTADNDDVQDNAPQQFTQEMDAKMQRMHHAEPLDGEEVVRRARIRLGETRYDYLSYNCEHFVTWARYGVGASPQATSHTNQVLAGALLGAAVGGLAGLMVGGAISLFTKMNALSASSSGVGTAEIEHSDAEEIEESDSSEEEGRQQRRRDERERLLEDIAAIQLEERDTDGGDFETWVAARRHTRTTATPRPYSEERHKALAARLAEDKLLCGICFYDLQLTCAVAFPCDHFTCTKCHDALVMNGSGYKCCPYCRMHITTVQAIHRSTKRAANDHLKWEEDVTAATAASAQPSG